MFDSNYDFIKPKINKLKYTIFISPIKQGLTGFTQNKIVKVKFFTYSDTTKEK